MERYQGSLWRRWDLHLHSPSTVLNNQFEGLDEEDKWNRYIAALEAITGVSVLGITDYFSIEGYRKIREFKRQGKLSDFDLILPNVELRILPVTDQNKAINLHVLFSPDIVPELDSAFFSNLEFEYNGNGYKCLYDDLVRLGRECRHEPRLDEKAAYEVGVAQFKVTVKDLTRIFDKNQRLRENSITAVSNSNRDGNSGIQHSSLAATREEIYRFSQLIFSGNPKDAQYFLGKGPDSEDEIIRRYGSLKPCVHGSDAHNLSKICAPDFQRFTWIKADPTFEGLRQIVFEPKYRVVISAAKPISPPLHIKKAVFNFPSDSKIEKDSFCLAGENVIQFNPHFTCLIGGRGTGKSMVLNLIHERIKPGQNRFFSENAILSSEDKLIPAADSVSVDGDSEEKYIEFLSQNEIEEFAQDYKRLTTAIYSRILKRDQQGHLTGHDEALGSKLRALDAHIETRITLKRRRELQDQKQKELRTNQKIVDSFSSEEYQTINQGISKSDSEIHQIVNSHERLNQLLTSLDDIVKQFEISEQQNDYDLETARVVEKLSDILTQSQSLDFSKLEARKETLEKELTEQKEKIRQYLADKGLTEENVKDISNANLRINALNGELSRLSNEINKMESSINNLAFDELEKASNSFKTELIAQIKSVSSVLEDLNNRFVKPITLRLDFDSESAKDKIFDHFKATFQTEIEGAALKGEAYLRELLYVCEPEDVDTQSDFLDLLQDAPSKAVAKDFLMTLFSSNYDFETYQAIIRRHHLDRSAFKKIDVLYDGQRIASTSFGQRCTATLVILLLLGNNPIIIDEPEAHLDSLLISNYLVEVIKEKKQNRQIIFATHNANFVINGDAELIHVLSMDQGKKTIVSSTSIENLETRETLIGLEGGREAFERREHKYKISSALSG